MGITSVYCPANEYEIDDCGRGEEISPKRRTDLLEVRTKNSEASRLRTAVAAVTGRIGRTGLWLTGD